MIKSGILALGACALLATSSAMAAPNSVGEVEFSKGSVSASNPNLGQRNLAKNSDLYTRDTVQTGDKSFSVLRFRDDGKVSVRPLSRFQVASYTNNQAQLKLERGGVTLETAQVGRTDPAQVVVDTPLARINSQQAVVQVRLCSTDCRDEGVRRGDNSEVAARVVSIKGKAEARAQGGGESRTLRQGAPLYRSDQLETGPGAQLLAVFRDGGRISLGASSEVNISDYSYGEGRDKSSLQLVKGSLRALTGRIGQAAPANYSIETPVAIIGVRGTAFDLLYPANAQGRIGAGGGLLSHVRQGSIQQKNSSGTFDLGTRKVNYISGRNQSPTSLPTPPAAMLRALGLTPESARISLEQLFGDQKLNGMPPGLYVYAQDGHVRLTGNRGAGKGQVLNLGRSEGAYVDEKGNLMRLELPPIFPMVGMLPSPVPGTFDQIERPEIEFVPPVQSMPVLEHYPGHPTYVEPPHFTGP